ncbi:MAG: DUF1801 domain-containing protein [Candidatus Saccharimonadales bacterium]
MFDTHGKTSVMTVDEYIANFEGETRIRLEQVRNLIRQLAPTASEGISYGIPTYKLNGKNMVHFAGYIKHVGLYPTPSTVTAFEQKLVGYVHAKGSVQFPHEQPFPIGLIGSMIEHRHKEMAKA